MQTLLEILNKTAAFFEKKEIENARLNAELLFAHVLKCKRLDLYLQFERPMDDDALDAIRPLVKRRGQREPLQYIVGDTDFYDLTLKVQPGVLVPRPETEELIEFLEKAFKAKTAPKRILDLGTGSGAIALSLAHVFPESEVVAVDFSEEALAVARSNAVLNELEERVRFVQSSWFDGLEEEPFDLIVSNPPYLTEEEWETAEPEVKDFEPKTALVAEDAGLSDLKHILQEAKPFLKKGAMIAFETGIAHHDTLSEVAATCDYSNVESLEDIHGRKRFFFCQFQ